MSTSILTRGTAIVTAAELEEFRTVVTNDQYANTVLHLARAKRLRPKVLADAAYTAWLKSENPKKIMPASYWTELFRLAYQADHELFEVQD
ncbi:hypothetical protein [Arthrobacter sp. Leaf137]|uniref:hypothetical protein n=1 Tax=Arthrobacter sp. Leaf137 TaxID=1736271 RepID=UPI0006FCF2EC|nr:hypothetical protein [Arthrobacter sp. Leaf137]KQQ89451.1 hypothetical protein ASF64_17590 [Arthrobacter sp. Leaf137]